MTIEDVKRLNFIVGFLLGTLILAECYCFSGDVTNAIINLNQCIEIFRTKLPLAKEGLCKGELQSIEILTLQISFLIAM